MPKSSHCAYQRTRSDRSLLGAREFPFPKSLYAVEDALRFFVRVEAKRGRPRLLRRLRHDGARRDAPEQAGRRATTFHLRHQQRGRPPTSSRRFAEGRPAPGDPEWEALGICEYITKPRIAAAITGMTPDGEPIKGDYKFTDEFPMADGFEENVEFFTLTYEAPLRVASHRDFERIAPLLWLRAGSRGRRIDDVSRRAGTSRRPTACSPTSTRSSTFLEALATISRRRRDRVHRHRRGPAVPVGRA